MTPPIRPDAPPNVELELAKLANDAMANGADPHETTAKLHDMLGYLRKFPKMAEHATNALADGVATPADVSRMLYPHVKGYATSQRASVEPTAEESANLPADEPGVVGKVATHLANVSRGVPGGELAEVGFRMMGRGQPYDEAYRDIHRATEAIPTPVKIGERLVGAIPLARLLPGSAAGAGALVGGADQLLDADPNQSLTERGVRTAAGATVGGLVGKTLENGVTLGRSLLAKKPATLLLEKQAERAASAKQLFNAALQEGHNNGMSPEIQSFLKEPQVAEIVDALKQTDQFANVPAESPEMLDAVYKTLSDQVGTAKRGLDAAIPRNANQGRFRLGDLRGKQQRLIDAMQAPANGSVTGSMPSYAKAVQDYAERTREIEAIQRGYDAFRTAQTGRLPSAKNLTRTTPEAFAEWAGKATPQEVAGARQGILGANKMALRGSANPLQAFGLRPALNNAGEAASLLRDARTPSQAYLELLQNAGLLTAGSTTP